MSSSVDLPARVLEWDSRFFEKKIARVNGKTLTPEYSNLINDWASSNHIDCLYFLANPDNDETIKCAEEQGYHLVDIRITLAINLQGRGKNPSLDDHIRLAKESDVNELRHIAGLNHTISRFFTDSHFDRKKCRELYEIWINNDVKGDADRVFVWDVEGKAVGYVTAKKKDGKNGSIGLVGISPDWRAKGLGKKLVSASLDYFGDQGILSTEVVTQGRNILALNLYLRNGFVFQSVELWYHKWFTEKQ